jgi:GntR family transcriptional repressor for pyruvate dehydrogenase complex
MSAARAVPLFEPVRLPRASEEAARRIAAAIREGVLARGARLPSERDLAKQLAVSRVTVRDAIRLLSDARLVEVKVGAAGGCFVASELVPLDFLQPMLTLKPGEMIDILQARRLVLPRIAEVASMNLRDADIERMEEAIRFGRDIGTSRPRRIPHAVKQRLSIASMRFDLALAGATGNALLVRIMTMLLTWLDPMRILLLKDWDDVAFAIDILAETLKAVGSGDKDAIHRVLDRRMSQIENEWEAANGYRVRRERPAFLDGLS